MKTFTPENLIDVEKLGEILVAHWSNFIDSTKLMVWTMQKVRNNLDNFIISDANFNGITTKITVSRFEIYSPEGFILWIDFTIPHNEKIAAGTIEVILSLNGTLKAEIISGNLYYIQTANSFSDVIRESIL